MAAGLADAGRVVTLVADAARPDGGPADPAQWLGRWPASLRAIAPARPHRPPLAGLLFRRNLRRASVDRPVLLCRDPRVAAAAATNPRFASVVHEWHVRPDPADRHHAGALAALWHVTVAEGLRQDLLDCGVPAERILLLPNACGLDPAAAERRSRGSGEGVIALGLHRRGGLDGALEAWRLAPDLPVLRLGGRDQGGARLLQWARSVAGDPSLEGRVRFFGPAWAADREALLDEAGVWLALYPDDEDTRTRLCPLQIADALGSGLPVVATDLPSIRAMSDAPHFVRPGDPVDLVRALREAIASPRQHTPQPSWQDRAARLIERVEAAL